MIDRHRRPAASRQRGQAAAEFVIIGLLFLAMFSGLVEMTYVFRAKHLLNTATFEAARAGALHNARLAPMQAMLVQGMAPLYMQGKRDSAGLQDATTYAGTVLTAMEESAAAMGSSATLGPDTAPLQIISPTWAVYNHFARTQDVRLADQALPQLQEVMPNDNLEWRSHSADQLGGMTISLQDANLLKIRTFWCQALLVPGLDSFFHSVITTEFTPTPQQQMCDAAGDKLNAERAQEGDAYTRYYIAIESSAVIRMQSPVVGFDLSGAPPT